MMMNRRGQTSKPYGNYCFLCIIYDGDTLIFKDYYISYLDHAMAQAVSRQPLIAEAWVRAHVSPCGICGGQSGTGTGFSPVSIVPLALHIHVASRG
jgi:hypothetical protein